MTAERFEVSPLLEATHIEKSYGATHVLKGTNFRLRRGEIHALLGGNGAGKSTLIRIVTGLAAADAGRIQLRSVREDGKPPVIAVVHQELALLPELTVAENIGIAHATSAFSLARRGHTRSIAAEALRLIDPALAERILDIPARTLSLHEGQVVEIARALSIGAEILLLDEPTANLTAGETEKLFSLLRRLAREKAIGIVFVSHRMKEIRALCDTCSILRDGRTVVDAAPMTELADADIVAHMGQPAHRAAVSRKRVTGSGDQKGALRLDGPAATRLDIQPGTILGLAGAPSGPSALIAMLVGARTSSPWRLSGDGIAAPFRSPREAIRAGVGFVPGDRAGKGVLSKLPILDNVVAARRVRDGRGFVRRGERDECSSLVAALQLKAGSIWDLPGSLSGGNQQKLLVARWLDLPLRMVVLEEPTRGVDIGTKRDIYALIRRMAEAGAIIVWWSTENVELLELCDAIFAFDTDGTPKGFLAGERFDEDGLAELTGMAA
ncbi:ATP-binding cassette domain-containing protein [Aureimonas phyllosphaerae]|uniref:Ribose transport system ATP-binding protein n=1 Tax=Aureimonas phyllosphaerae TaxID=1166078 RepID=A0A7W6C0T4_9HYPH|nr:sugar ABC transporter ATP-binding protein [Aureimonas phyllosphaerae]MBB3937316.1 ribose transport system ATP-binding protein [Aureimonas phyllosphaerae]MBB3961323.1 ribose transport system ATP-binding protein [Aureimonas phyllosphaerae]SFF41864.1 monosaccharide ABC transporter ATP-binding protein, CUT2 family [Aureimonas phyllosphaerae]